MLTTVAKEQQAKIAEQDARILQMEAAHDERMLQMEMALAEVLRDQSSEMQVGSAD